MQSAYDSKVAKLAEMERQLILQEEKVFRLENLKQSAESSENSIKKDFVSLQGEYEHLRVERNSLETRQVYKPFSKTECNAVGNAGC